MFYLTLRPNDNQEAKLAKKDWYELDYVAQYKNPKTGAERLDIYWDCFREITNRLQNLVGITS